MYSPPAEPSTATQVLGWGDPPLHPGGVFVPSNPAEGGWLRGESAFDARGGGNTPGSLVPNLSVVVDA